jgi:hypothetical protein
MKLFLKIFFCPAYSGAVNKNSLKWPFPGKKFW